MKNKMSGSQGRSTTSVRAHVVSDLLTLVSLRILLHMQRERLKMLWHMQRKVTVSSVSSDLTGTDKRFRQIIQRSGHCNRQSR